MLSKTSLFASAAALLGGAAILGATAGAQNSTSSYSADALEIEGFIGRIEVRTGGSSGIEVAISNPGEVAADPVVSENGARVIIDGGQSMRNMNCSSRNGSLQIGSGGSWWGRGERTSIDEYPVLTITAPDDLALEIRDSAFLGETGDVGSLMVSMNSCGDFRAADVADEAHIRINGSGDVYLEDVGRDVTIDINGSGDVELDTVGGDAEIDIAGSGDVAVADVSGDVGIDINGSGDVRLGEIGGLAVRISGSGDIIAQEMQGGFDARINGSGDIQVRGGRAEPFEATISGSGDIRFDGTAANVTVNESGSGDVHVEDVEGPVSWRRNGRTVLSIGSAD